MLPVMLLLLAPGLPQAEEASWNDWWTDNLRWSIDESVRTVINDEGGLAATIGFLGIDLHKVISTDSGDVATLTLQPYLTRVDSLSPNPPLFDGPDDWELVWRIFNANIKLRQDGALNLRLGHFEIPFGIEHLINTNGTLRDYIHPPQFGLKADWGATLNGDLESFEYELAWSRGSGNEYRSEGDPGVVSGRLGTPRDNDRVFGISFVDGDFRTPGGILERNRVGLDALIYHKDLGFFAELSTGENGGDTDVMRALAEVNWRNAPETTLAWWQLISTDIDGPGGDTSALDSKLGIRWLPAQGWTLSAQYVQNLDPAVSGAHRTTSFALQIRYRF